MLFLKSGKEIKLGESFNYGSKTEAVQRKWRLVLYYGCPTIEIFMDQCAHPDASKFYSYLTHPGMFNDLGVQVLMRTIVRHDQQRALFEPTRDRATDPRTQKGLHPALRLAMATLHSVEWVHFAQGDQSDDEGLFCPWCGAGQAIGHYDSCQRDLALLRLEESLEQERLIETELTELYIKHPIVQTGVALLQHGQFASKHEAMLAIIKSLIEINAKLHDLLANQMPFLTLVTWEGRAHKREP